MFGDPVNQGVPAPPLTRARVIEMLNNFADGQYQTISPDVCRVAASLLADSMPVAVYDCPGVVIRGKIMPFSHLFQPFNKGEAPRCVRCGLAESDYRTAPAKEASAELLPCPFCGQEGAVRLMDNVKNHWRVLCMNDECDIGPFAEHFGRAEAVTAWNRRSSPVREGDLGQATPSVSAEKHERDLGEVIDEREAAEQAISQAYYLVVGESAEWSNMFGYSEALKAIDETMAALRSDQARPSSADLSRGSDVPSALSDEFIQQCIDTGSMTREVRLIALREIQYRRLAFSALHKALPDLGNMIQSRLSANRDGPLSSDERSNLSDFLAVLRAPASPSEPSGRGESGEILSPASEASMNKGEQK